MRAAGYRSVRKATATPSGLPSRVRAFDDGTVERRSWKAVESGKGGAGRRGSGGNSLAISLASQLLQREKKYFDDLAYVLCKLWSC